VINTCDEYKGPIIAYEKYDIKQLWLPIIDFTSPSLLQIESAVAFIENYATRHETVYLHCKAGKGRSTTIALCYLMKSQRISAQKALLKIIEVRPQVSKYLWRRPVVIEFARRYNIETEDCKTI